MTWKMARYRDRPVNSNLTWRSNRDRGLEREVCVSRMRRDEMAMMDDEQRVFER